MKESTLTVLSALAFAVIFFGALNITSDKPPVEPVTYRVVIVDKNKIIHSRQTELIGGILEVRLDGKDD